MKKRKPNWSGQYAKEYSSPEYRRNRKIVLERDAGICFRCFELFGLLKTYDSCDHFMPLRPDHKDHSLNNLWLLCDKCHDDKGLRERTGKKGFSVPVDAEGWKIAGHKEPDWLSLIESKNKRLNLI